MGGTARVIAGPPVPEELDFPPGEFHYPALRDFVVFVPAIPANPYRYHRERGSTLTESPPVCLVQAGIIQGTPQSLFSFGQDALNEGFVGHAIRLRGSCSPPRTSQALQGQVAPQDLHFTGASM